MESFFSSLKAERVARQVYRSREQARSDVFDYIERVYNRTRSHSALGYISRIQFEKLRSVVHRTGSSPNAACKKALVSLENKTWRGFGGSVGWLMGLEPTTTGITILDSTN